MNHKPGLEQRAPASSPRPRHLEDDTERGSGLSSTHFHDNRTADRAPDPVARLWWIIRPEGEITTQPHICTFKGRRGGSRHRDTWPSSSQMPDWLSGNSCLPLLKSESVEEEWDGGEGWESEREKNNTCLRREDRFSTAARWAVIHLAIAWRPEPRVRRLTRISAIELRRRLARLWNKRLTHQWACLEVHCWARCEELCQVFEEEVGWHVFWSNSWSAVAWNSTHTSGILNYSNSCCAALSRVDPLHSCKKTTHTMF